MIIGRRFTFCASHQLHHHLGKCKNLHGHNYVLEVQITGPISLADGPGFGMVMDFSTLDKMVQMEVIDPLDHTHINDKIPDPTAENILSVIVGWLSQQLVFGRGPVRLHSVKLWENERSWAYWEAGK